MALKETSHAATGPCLEPCENCLCQENPEALPCQSHRDRIQAAIKRYTERVNRGRL
jgi:hypothetical protein